MTVHSWHSARTLPRRDAALQTSVAGAVFLGLVVARLALQYLTAGGLTLEDDAYYYAVVARNIAQTGISTFDGQTLTNGYHPLWLLLLVVQDLLVGPSVAVTIALDVALATAGTALLASTLQTRSVLLRIVFAVAMGVATRPFVAKGMEVSLLILAIGVFTRTFVSMREGRSSPLALGFAAAFCIGARIDSAVFVLPVLLLACRSLREGATALAPLAVAGALYAGANLLVFGIAFPISGAVKSLGGLQINERLLHQVAREAAPAGHMSALSFANALIGRCFVCVALCCVALPFTAAGSKGRLLAGAYIVGFAAFAGKLVFASSWLVWPWYTFPVVFGLVALFHIADDLALAERWALPSAAEAALAALLVAGAAWQLRAGATRVEPSFERLNRQALAAFAPVLQGQRIAMGDRAGSVAQFYDGPVTQLEGLVNDVAYLDALRTHADLKPLLCRRGVRFVLSYQRDLGDYASITVPVMRPWLTSFASPALTFARGDEVGHLSDLAVFDNRAQDDEGDVVLYAWRLSGCDAAR